MKRLFLLLLLPSLAVTLGGCTAAVVGGAAVTAAGLNVAHDRRPVSTIINDQNLKLSVQGAIGDDRALASHNHIRVLVYNRVIVLLGEVADEQARSKAGKLASGFIGARRVVNLLDIMPEPSFWQRRADNALTARIKTGLLDITEIRGFSPDLVNITVAHGEVYLLGLVTHAEAAAVIDNARNTRGVKRVINLFEYIDGAGTGGNPNPG